MIARRVVVHGRVQGVFFRDSCRDAAAEAGVTGWVRNRSDGAVEAVFEGDDAAVESMCDWCRAGPRHADVDSVNVEPQQPTGATGFEVR
ncbi:MAG: acylphosphatase [Nocardioidaceae bacterium]